MPLFFLLLSLVGAASDAFGQEAQLRVQTRNDDSGQPVAGVLIHVLWEDSGRLYAEAWTDDKGVTTIHVAPLETYRVRAVAPGYSSQTQFATPLPGVTLDVTLGLELLREPDAPFGVLSGRVLTWEGEPLARVHVLVMGWPEVTANDGSYRFALQPGSYLVQTFGTLSPIDSPDAPVFDKYGPARRDGVIVAPNAETGGVDLVLSPTRKYRATVTVVDHNGPVSEGLVGWVASDGSTGAGSLGSNGSAAIGPLPSGRVTIFVTTGTKPSRMAGMTSIEIGDGPRDDIVISVFPGATLRGRIVGLVGFRIRVPSEVQVRVLPIHPDGLDIGDLDDSLVNEDGTFLLSGLLGERCLEPNGLWGPGWGVLAITHAGVDITGRALTFDYGQELRDVVVHLGPKEPEPYLGPSPTPRCTR